MLTITQFFQLTVWKCIQFQKLSLSHSETSRIHGIYQFIYFINISESLYIPKQYSRQSDLCCLISVNKDFPKWYLLYKYPLYQQSSHGPNNLFIPQAVDKWVQKRCDDGVKHCHCLALFWGMQGVWSGVGGESSHIEQACHSQVRETSGNSLCLSFTWAHLKHHSKYTGIGC